MGADLIAAMVMIPKHRSTPDVNKIAQEYIDSLTDEENDDYELQILVENMVPEGDRHGRIEDNIAAVTELLKQLETLLTTPGRARGEISVQIGGYWLYIAGGTSSGDDPCPEFTILNWVYQMPHAQERLFPRLDLYPPWDGEFQVLRVPKFDDTEQADEWMEEVARGNIPAV